MIRKIIYAICFLSFLIDNGLAQSLKSVTLKHCEDSAKVNSPLLNQNNILHQVLDLNQQNLKANYYPSFDLSGQATYQSATFELPFEIPNFNIPDVPKDQYKIAIDAKQLIYDGGYYKAQLNVYETNEKTEEQKIAVEEYKLKDKVNQLYFSVLLQNSLMQLTTVMRYDLINKQLKIKAGIDNGVANDFNNDMIKAELLKAEQKMTEYKAAKSAAVNSLALLTGLKIDTSTYFSSPVVSEFSKPFPRPELALFTLQQENLLSLQQLNQVQRMPKVFAFAQGGYGRPAFNQFDPRFQPFYIVGLKLTWNIWNWNVTTRQNQILQLNAGGIKIQQELFEQNIQLQQIQQSAEVDKLQKLIALDGQIVKLKKSIADEIYFQASAGAVTMLDYATAVNDQNQAEQQERIHKLQLLFMQINLLTTQGN